MKKAIFYFNLFHIFFSIDHSSIVLAQTNLVPNGDMESGGTPACSYPTQTTNPQNWYNPNISNWSNAKKKNSQLWGTFDWYDWNFAQINGCTPFDSDMWKQPLPPIVSNRWIGVYGADPENTSGFRGEIVRVQLKYPLKAGNYFLKMKAAFTSRTPFLQPPSNLKIRIHVSKYGEDWYKVGGNIFIKDATNFILDRTNPDQWQQFSTVINIPESIANEMQELIIEPHYDNAESYLFYDDVSLVLDDNGNNCCPDHRLFQNTDQLPVITEVNDYIKAGFSVDPNTPTGPVVVQSGKDVTFQAGNTITLDPGFSTQPGANFVAQIGPCKNSDLEGIAMSVFVPNAWAGCPFIDKFCIPTTGATHWSFQVYASWGNPDKPNTYKDIGYDGQGSIDGLYTCIWDGNINGGTPNTSAFVYKLTLTNNCGEELKRHGNISFLNTCREQSNAHFLNSDTTYPSRRNQFQVSPNPSTGKFTIYFNDIELIDSKADNSLNISISNVLGELVYKHRHEYNTGAKSFEMNLFSKPKGFYFLEIQHNKTKYTEKIILH